MPRSSDKKEHERALKRFKLVMEAMSAQRKQELEALKFDAGDQWEDFVRRARNGEVDPTGGTSQLIGQRPCLTINKTNQPIQQVINQAKNADLGITIHAGTDASKKDAEIRQGLIRHIQVKSRASLARNWAYERAVKCGRGFYKISKVYNDEDPRFPFDQDLAAEPIENQGNCELDPFALQPDSSDANWAFEWDDMPETEFTREYPDAELPFHGDGRLKAEAEANKEWVGGEEEARTVRVARYWYKTYTKRTVTLYVFPDGHEEAIWKDEEDKLKAALDAGAMPATYDDGETAIERLVQQPEIYCCPMTVLEFLEDDVRWEGTIIPIIPVIGNKYNLNGKKLWTGIIQQAMDAQRLFNYTASEIATATGLATKAPYELDPEQIEGNEHMWRSANTKLWPYLPRKSFDRTGKPFLPVQRNTQEPPIQALSQLLQQADAFIQATTNTPAPALGRIDLQHRSGKAINELQKQSELANSNYLDNFADVSLTKEGIIDNEMLQYVYDRPGRVVQILGTDDKPERVMLNQPFVRDQQTKQPVAVPQGQPMQGVEQYDLSKGRYTVVVEVGKSFMTRQQEGASAMGELINAAPGLAPVIAPFWIGNMDFPGAQSIADILKKMLPPEAQGEGGDANAQAAAKLAQLSKVYDEVVAQLKQAQQKIETDWAKAQKDISVAKMDNDTKVQIARIQAASSLLVAEVKVSAEAQRTELMQEMEQLKLIQGAVAKEREQLRDHAHETGTQLRDQQHEAGTQARDQDHKQAMQRADIATQLVTAAQKESATPNGAKS